MLEFAVRPFIDDTPDAWFGPACLFGSMPRRQVFDARGRAFAAPIVIGLCHQPS